MSRLKSLKDYISAVENGQTGAAGVAFKAAMAGAKDPDDRQIGSGLAVPSKPSLKPSNRLPALPPALPLGDLFPELRILDAHLPAGGLPRGCLHEIEATRPEWDDGPATGFCLALLARIVAQQPPSLPLGPVLWISPWRDLYLPALSLWGLDPSRFLLVHPSSEADLLWAMEEGLNCPSLAAVVGETGPLEARAGRRLQLAAKAKGVTAFSLQRGLRHRPRLGAASGQWAATTRWRVGSNGKKRGYPSADGPKAHQAEAYQADLGPAVWQLELLRCRNAAPGSWLVRQPAPLPPRSYPLTDQGGSHATDAFGLAAPLCNGPMVS
ncbi:MAG: hypothetical protein AAF530_24485 [Pseudomonadota bacterium]